MNTMDANQMLPSYELKDELARFCLPAANRDPNRKLAWINSICILFLLIGILGAKPAAISLKPLPPMEQAIPVVVEAPPPPQTVTPNQNQEQPDQEKSEAPQVVVVTPPSQNINFSVPTIGNLVVPNAIAQAPPLQPLQPPAPLQTVPSNLSNTGTGGERPQPPYPRIALEQAEQGTVTVLMTGDGAGNIVSVQLKQSSGSGILDRATLDFIKRHWTLPVAATNQLFETSITYKLQAN